MKWKTPPVIKIYEALGAISDDRVTLEENTAKVFSSSGNKFYTVTYDAGLNVISSNDNGSFWQKYLGYPAISFLMCKGIISYGKESTEYLYGFAWKDINTSFKNDFLLTEKYIREEMAKKGCDLAVFDIDLKSILQQIEDLQLEMPDKLSKPPKGY